MYCYLPITVKFFPTPSKDRLYLEMNKTPVYVKIMSITGQVVYTEKVVDKNHLIDLQNLSNGIYLMQLNGDNFVQTEKVVIQK
ncbi:MAG TPA: T9SS type A sorting domain-containing protein [Bacteroidia bacterium]|nr:T9SS type A sorting domain-containing protein [Bacteroidia bacterium]